jgi:hypothetical protein
MTPDDNPLLRAIESNAPLVERLQIAKMELARRAALLGWLAENTGEVEDALETARAIGREIRVLRRYVDLELAEHRTQHDEVDPYGPEARVVYDLLVTRVGEVAVEVLGVETGSALIAECRRRLTEDPEIPWP